MNTKNELNEKVDVKFILAALWTGHFLLWSFGDMLALLQKMSAPTENSLLLFVAVPLAIIQASMIFLNLAGKAKFMCWVNIVLSFVYLVFNAGYILEAQVGWEYLLGAGYVLFNGLIIWHAWKLKK